MDPVRQAPRRPPPSWTMGAFDHASGLPSVAERHGVSLDAVRHLVQALERGHGTMAQFDHPDLGGMGQWFSGGMVMVGRMFDDGLKARVDALCTELAAALRRAASRRRARGAARRRRVVAGRSRGAGEHRLAERAALRLFPGEPAARRRIGRGRRASTIPASTASPGCRRRTAASASPARWERSISNACAGSRRRRPPRGRRIRRARRTRRRPRQPRRPSTSRTGPGVRADVLATIERLADLHARGVLTEREFSDKKAELLARL